MAESDAKQEAAEAKAASSVANEEKVEAVALKATADADAKLAEEAAKSAAASIDEAAKAKEEAAVAVAAKAQAVEASLNVKVDTVKAKLEVDQKLAGETSEVAAASLAKVQQLGEALAQKEAASDAAAKVRWATHQSPEISTLGFLWVARSNSYHFTIFIAAF